ncbi:xin actin-binding repeat-containing protein 2 isoform X3 [Chelonus insularis]|uniref:xin actin-binding repeat-containing protein 2 isoform X3 n=1 Tax=Chelonus insularis TaxID=460826 RepID=UPI001588C410|nr:xin actin-binding repeat-containing protein 2 isoform X3 [Chelonus insularis]
MAELMEKKSTEIVSTTKNEFVCGAMSNTALIDLDQLTTSNSQLLNICGDKQNEDDLIRKNNTKNELCAEEKSLQELIESELALRIYMRNDTETDELISENDQVLNGQSNTSTMNNVAQPHQDLLLIDADLETTTDDSTVSQNPAYDFYNDNKCSDFSNINQTIENKPIDPIDCDINNFIEIEKNICNLQDERNCQSNSNDDNVDVTDQIPVSNGIIETEVGSLSTDNEVYPEMEVKDKPQEENKKKNIDKETEIIHDEKVSSHESLASVEIIQFNSIDGVFEVEEQFVSQTTNTTNVNVEQISNVEDVMENGADEKRVTDEMNVELNIQVTPTTTNDLINLTKITNTGVCDSSMRFSLSEQLPDLGNNSNDDLSSACDSESCEEVITVTSSTTKNSTKTKKKKIEGVTGNDVSSTVNTSRTKKTKKSKKSDLEKENISVKSSFNKFDALSKKSVLHARSIDAVKADQHLNLAGQNGDANPNCRSCGKVVFQMEQTKAEGLIWHKNCFRCAQCSKQLNVDNYESHESTLYCKPHFKELFQPKPVEESNRPTSDKPDLGLEELSSLNVKSRFQVFEKSADTSVNDIERSPSQVLVKRSPSILSKLAKFQAKGMDIGVADESLNGIPYEESSESEEEEENEQVEEVDSEIVKSKRVARERPISFTKMDDIKNRWEVTSQQGRRESQREARKEEIAGIRSRLFMGKQGKMKELYQQAVATSERVTKTNPVEEIQCTMHARSIKEKFERGEPMVNSNDEEDSSSKLKQEKPDEEVIAAGISRKSRSLFLELDATAAKSGRPMTPVNNVKTSTEVPRRARDAFMGRQVSDDVVRSTDTTEEVKVETSEISNKFKFFESYKEPEKQRKQFRITPPRDGEIKMNSPEREIYRDPDVVRADDKVDEVVHTDTTKKMLSIFRQMEEKATREDVPDGPKPLKRFTPPPEDKYAKQTTSDSEIDDEEDGNESASENSMEEERNPNYVRASDKMEDEFLKNAQNAAKAKTLRAKFEQWKVNDEQTISDNNTTKWDVTSEQVSSESAKSLKARFESLGSQPAEVPRSTRVKVNRFVNIQTTDADVCNGCQKKVYPLEKVETNNKIFHKQCFRCLQCNCVLRMDTFTLNNGKLYCISHFKQLFIARGNYEEGFGIDPHKNKWISNLNLDLSSNNCQTSPIANHT